MVPDLIPVVQKASNVCAYCRVRKQRCDRMLPRCNRCDAKNQDCDYTPPYQSSSPSSEPLVFSHKDCGHADLTPRGATELVQAIKAYIDAPNSAGPTTDLLDLIVDILNTAGFDMCDALARFGPSVQQWCPILLEDQILANCDYLVKNPVSAQDGPKRPVLWMAMWLVLRKPCSPRENMGASELYSAVKQVHALMQSALELDLSVLQIGLIIAVYELGHGLRQQAFQTLAICTTTLTFLELEATRRQDAETLNVVGWLKASIAMIDRQLPLSMLSNPLPLTLSADHAMTKALRKGLDLGFPPVPKRPSASSPFKVFVRTAATICCAPALDYIYSCQYACEPKHTYDYADAAVNKCISMLVVKPGSKAMFHCDAMPMTVCTHIVLQLTQIQHLHAKLPESHVSASPEYQKVMVALRFARSMAWDVVRVALLLQTSEEGTSKVTLAGMCSILRAGLAVLETAPYIDDGVVGPGEVEGYLKLLGWFAARWTLGGAYVERARVVLGQSA